MINSCMKLKEVVQENMVTHLLQMCQKELEIQDLPEIELINEPFLEGGDKKSFGIFDGKIIRVVVKGRHPMDVMRTLAHEIVHWAQMNSGMDMDGSDGSEAENDANARAGVIMRQFGERYPDYFLSTLP